MKIDLTIDAIEHQHFHMAYRKVRKELERTCRFKHWSIQVLLMTYYKFVLLTNRNFKYMTRNQFSIMCHVVFGMMDLRWVDSIISYIDPSSKNAISPRAFVQLMDIWVFGSLKEKIALCFGVYNVHKSGYITREHLLKSCRNMVYAQSAEDMDELVVEYVDFVLRRFDVDRDGKISFEDYSQTVMGAPSLLEFLGTIIPDKAIMIEIFK